MRARGDLKEMPWLLERVKGIESEDRVQPNAETCGFPQVFAECDFDELHKKASSRTLFGTTRH